MSALSRRVRQNVSVNAFGRFPPRPVAPAKPLRSLRAFASALGWSPLRVHRLRHPFAARLHLKTKAVTWYEAGNSAGDRTDLFLQINEQPGGGPHSYAAAVYAVRFRICTGWHAFQMGLGAKSDRAEAQRLEEWLHHRWFASLASRQQFRANHPECAGYSWKRIRREGPPYQSC